MEVGHSSLEDTLKFDWSRPLHSEESKQKEEDEEWFSFARILVAGTIEHLDEIDEIIKKHLKTWDFERINKVSLSILRMSVYSLKYQTDVLPSIVIDEAIHIAKDFGPDDSFKFVNAMLDNIKKFLNDKKSEEITDNKQ